MRREFNDSGNGCLPDIMENELSSSAMKILFLILEQYSSDQFSLQDLEELLKINEKSFQHLIDYDIILEVEPKTAVFVLNYNHPVVVAHSASLSDIMEQD